MKRFSLACGVVAAGLLGAACSSGDDVPPPLAVESATVARKLEAALGSRIDAVDDGRTGKPYLYVAVDDGRPAVIDPKAPSLSFLAPVAADLGVASLEAELGEPTSVVPASEETAGTIRYAQHVPGTSIPVFDAELIVSTRVDGSVAFVQPTLAPRVSQLRTTPALSPSAARDALRRAVPDALDVPEPILGVSAADPTTPRLAYRADVPTAAGAVRATLDADEGTAITLVPLVSGARALAARAASYYVHAGKDEHPSRTDPAYVADAAASIVFDEGTGTMLATTDFGAVDVRSGSLTGPRVEVDLPPAPRSPTAILTCDLGEGNETSGIAVDAQSHLFNVVGAYQKRFGAASLGLGRPMTVVVHDNTKGNHGATYYALTNSIHFGDGDRGVYEVNTADPDPSATDRTSLKRPEWFRVASLATSREVIAHEVAHALLYRNIATLGEAGAINEGVADVLANQLELDTGTGRGKFWTFGEGLHYRDVPFRNLYRPSETGIDGASAAHYSQLKSPQALTTDFGNVHFNSTVVSQPWVLMAWGGFNDVSKIGVTTEIGFERATALYWETARATGLWESSIKGFARKMIAYQTGKLQQHPTRTDLTGRWVRDAVICAWTAVGALTPDETRASYGITCPTSATLETTSCANKRDGLYCDSNPKMDGSFIECARAAIKSGFQCPSGTFCHRKTGSFDSPALTDERGKPICYPEPQAL